MLPFDNKDEFAMVIDMPDGKALPDTINMTTEIVEILRSIPETSVIQFYVGTAKSFDFNCLVRHNYLRQFLWLAEIQVLLQGNLNKIEPIMITAFALISQPSSPYSTTRSNPVLWHFGQGGIRVFFVNFISWLQSRQRKVPALQISPV